MDKKDIKYLCSFFLVVILLVCYGWYRTENNRLKEIEGLKEQITMLEEQVYSLRNDK